MSSSDDPIDTDSDQADEDYYQTSAQKRKAKSLENSLKKKQNKKALKDLEELQVFKAKHRYTYLEHVFIKMQLEGWQLDLQHIEGGSLKHFFGLNEYFNLEWKFIDDYAIPFMSAVGHRAGRFFGRKNLIHLDKIISFMGIDPFLETDVKKFFRFSKQYIKLVFIVYFSSNHYVGRNSGLMTWSNSPVTNIEDFLFTRFFERGIDNAMAQIARLNLPIHYIPEHDKPVDIRRFYPIGRQMIDFHVEKQFPGSQSQLFPWFKGDNYWTKGKHTACVTTSALKQVQFALFITNRHLKVDQSTLGFINDKIVHSILF